MTQSDRPQLEAEYLHRRSLLRIHYTKVRIPNDKRLRATVPERVVEFAVVQSTEPILVAEGGRQYEWLYAPHHLLSDVCRHYERTLSTRKDKKGYRLDPTRGTSLPRILVVIPCIVPTTPPPPPNRITAWQHELLVPVSPNAIPSILFEGAKSFLELLRVFHGPEELITLLYSKEIAGQREDTEHYDESIFDVLPKQETLNALLNKWNSRVTSGIVGPGRQLPYKPVVLHEYTDWYQPDPIEYEINVPMTKTGMYLQTRLPASVMMIYPGDPNRTASAEEHVQRPVRAPWLPALQQKGTDAFTRLMELAALI